MLQGASPQSIHQKLCLFVKVLGNFNVVLKIHLLFLKHENGSLLMHLKYGIFDILFFDYYLYTFNFCLRY